MMHADHIQPHVDEKHTPRFAAEGAGVMDAALDGGACAEVTGASLAGGKGASIKGASLAGGEDANAVAASPLPNLISSSAYEHCELCPRACGVNRAAGKRGRCGQTAQLSVARAALHFWEEPPISGETGSGTIFFAGCPLGCAYCQNHEIAASQAGTPITTGRLAAIMLELQDQGALNINLVTALHMAPHVAAAVNLARAHGLTLPIVCNASGYERPELIWELRDTVDIWLTDFKYASSKLAARYSSAPDYPMVAAKALAQMVAQINARGRRKTDADGRLLQGIIVRHLVLPGQAEDSCRVLEHVWNIAENSVDLSVMNQYTPNSLMRKQGGRMSGAVTPEEYEQVLSWADDLGFEQIWWQEGGTVSESFVPAFDGQGVLGPELADLRL